MIEHLNIQSIAKWFEKGCGSLDNEATNKNEKGFYILECNDICLLSKLADVKNNTLLERAHKQLKQIKEPLSRRDFLFTICNEFLRDGRRSVPLAMITEEIDSQTELYQMFRSDLLFHRALCYLKHDQPTEALCDLYLAFENGQIQSLDKVHVQILEEIKNFLKNRKFKEGFIVTKNNGQVTFEQVLKQYESEICHFIQLQIVKQKQEYEDKIEEQPQLKQENEPMHASDSVRQTNEHNKWTRDTKQFFYEETGDLSCTEDTALDCYFSIVDKTDSAGPTYKSKLLGESNSSDKTIARTINPTPSGDQCYTPPALVSINEDQSKEHIAEDGAQEIEFTYSVENQKMISVKQILNEQIIDNIFNLRAILVDKLCAEVNVTTVCEIFETFGTIVNVRYKENSEKLIIEYDNSESPRFAISYLSQVQLPYISEVNQYLDFRFYKSENQRNLRICKQNQIKTSRECYFWRTTGCQNVNCKFYHNKLAKGVDYQEWMKIEQLRSVNKDNVILNSVNIPTQASHSGRNSLYY